MIRNTISHFLKKQHELYPSYVGTDAFDLDKYRRVMYEPYREEIRKEDAAKGKKTEELVLSQNLKLSAEAGNILLISDENYAVTFTAENILRMGSSFVVNDSGCLPLRIRRYVQKSKFDHFGPDSNVVACSCKPFRDRQADRWDISLSDIAAGSSCRTFLASRSKEDPGKRWKNRESRIQVFVVPVGISGEPGISHIISYRNMPGRIYTGGYAYFRKYRD